MSLKDAYAQALTESEKTVRDALEVISRFYDDIHEKFMKDPNADYAHALCRALYLINEKALETPDSLIWWVLGNSPHITGKDHLYWLMVGYSDWLRKRRVGEW